MKITNKLLTIVPIVLLAACSANPPPIYESQRAVVKYIDSGKYLEDFADVVHEARRHLRKEVAKDSRNLAIVLDIDETALSNWPAYRVNGFARIVEGGCDLVKGPCGIRAWQALAKSPGLSPMLELVRDAQNSGVKVFFISGRPADLQIATEQNLKEAGYTFDRVVIYPPGAPKFASAVDFKAPERKKLTEEGLRVALCIGDQESDITGGYCERGFKLPNPVYQLP